jgi:hypothetical protein
MGEHPPVSRVHSFGVPEAGEGRCADTSRPSIEFYRSRKVIDLLLPVK